MRRSHLLLLALVVAMLAGCGNKGPLVLPAHRPTPAVSAPVAPAPATAASSARPATDQH